MLTVFLSLILRRVVARSAVIRSPLCGFFPRLVRRPAKRQHLYRARRGQGGKRLKRLEQNFTLQSRLVWFSSGVTERIVEKCGARRIHRLGNIQGAGHAQRGNTSGLSMTGNQSDGLVTHRSDGYQQDGIDFFC
jgi:hypothetical protein